MMLSLFEALKAAGILPPPFVLTEDSSFDRRQTQEKSRDIVDALKARFNVDVETTVNKNGSITIKVNGGNVAPDREGSNPNVVTARNLSAAIDKPYRDFRAKGWYFSQPARGEFTVGVPE